MVVPEPGTGVAVVGGGLAGLSSAILLARSGRHVTLLEKAAGVGGRAMTESSGGFQLNLGPHALYEHGAAAPALRSLGVPVRGGRPPAAGLAWKGGRLHVLPAGPLSLLRTRLFGFRARLQIAGFLARLSRRDPASAGGHALGDLLDREMPDPDARALVLAIARLTTYAAEPRTLSASAALSQIQLALRGVLYLDGGWQSLVDGLRKVATDAGVSIRTGTRVESIVLDGPMRGVRLAGGFLLAAPAIVLAVDPGSAADLLGRRGSVLSAAADRAPTGRIASLDLALSHLPRPRVRFALGIDRPLYFSVHSAAARLAPPGGAMIHAATCLPAEGDPATAGERAEIESFVDRLQPGWRDAVVHCRWRPNLVASSTLPTAASGGLAGRPGVEPPGTPGVFLAGDWVGPTGLLADAALSSATEAAHKAHEWLRRESTSGLRR